MKVKIGFILTLVVPAFFVVCCHPESVDTQFLEINEEGVAIYQVSNSTGKDIFRISFEFTFSNSDSEIIKADTVNYKMSESTSSRVWLEAGGQTHIAYKVPDSTNTTSVKIISISN